MPRKRKSMTIGPRQLYIMMESLAAAMAVIKGERPYDDIPPDEYKGIADAHDLWLELEEQWDALSRAERLSADTESFQPRERVRSGQRGPL